MFVIREYVKPKNGYGKGKYKTIAKLDALGHCIKTIERALSDKYDFRGDFTPIHRVTFVCKGDAENADLPIVTVAPYI